MSWKNPAYTGTKRFHRVGLSGNPVIRADFEDEMASRASATEMEIIPGNTILLRAEGAEFDPDYFKTQIREHKIDAVVVSRLVNIKNTVTYVPGLSLHASVLQHLLRLLRHHISYGLQSWLFERRKESANRNTFYSICSTEGELVWTCITDTFDSSYEKRAVEKLVKLGAKQMQREGVL